MAAPTLTPGQIIGHFRLIEKIGSGGMGIVYRAWDMRLERDVAVKILPSGTLADDDARRQFRKEALAVGKVNHPNVAMALDFGQENGIDYLVTEYVPGADLDEKLDQQPLPEESVLELGMQLASGLDAAHREAVIHRDLKPGNIRLNPDGQLKILDFGLARVIEPLDDTTETASLSSKLSVSGTMPYMAPEVLRAQSADARSDIWAAGAVLYEMATGQRAFPDRQPSLLIDAILHYDPVRPCLINPKISAQMEALILKALDRDPNRRYQSARELRTDLARIAAGEMPTDAVRRSGVVKVVREHRNRKALLILGAMLLVGIVIGYFVKRWWPLPPAQRRIMAVLPFDSVGQDPAANALGLGLTETLTTKLVQASDSNMIQVVSPRELRARGVKTVDDARREFGTDLVLEGSLQQSGQMYRITCNLVDSKTQHQLAARTITAETADMFGLQDEVVNETLDMLPARIKPEQRQALATHRDTQPAAYEAYIRGRGYLQQFNKPEDVDSAVAEFNRAIAIDPNYALGYAALGNAYRLGFQEFSRGTDWVAKASSNCEKALSLNPELVEGHICLGSLFNTTGKYDKAVEEFQRAMQSEPSSEDALVGLAKAYINLGNLPAAESTYRKAIALRPNYWGHYSALGYFYYGQARYSDAAEMFRKVTELAPNNYVGFSNLGGMYIAQGRYVDAIEAFQHSIGLRPGPEAYANLGYTYFLMHRFDDAVAALENVKPADREWQNWGTLADALYWLPNRRAEASRAYGMAISLALPKVEVNPRDANVLANLADYHAMLEDRQSAISYSQRALEAAPSDPEVLFRAGLVYNHFNETE